MATTTKKQGMYQVIRSIVDGDQDDRLDSIIDAARERKRQVAYDKTSALKRGDKVAFSESIRPKYLAGLTATVERLNNESVVVKCPNDRAYGRYAGQAGIRCANVLIEGKVG